MKYLDVTLTKKIKYMYGKNFNFLKEIEKDIRRWKDPPYSWISTINIVKMAILPKAICRFSAIPVKITTQFFTDVERAILNFIWKNKKSRISKQTIKEHQEKSPSLTSRSTTEQLR